MVVPRRMAAMVAPGHGTAPLAAIRLGEGALIGVGVHPRVYPARSPCDEDSGIVRSIGRLGGDA
jgi:hypothetical protein